MFRKAIRTLNGLIGVVEDDARRDWNSDRLFRGVALWRDDMSLVGGGGIRILRVYVFGYQSADSMLFERSK